MGVEIDILSVGDSDSKCGDAIALRYGVLSDRSKSRVVVIDGGYRPDGARLVDHIQTVYKTDVVDLVVSTHPDCDHTNGLEVVLQNLNVKAMWMHHPWNYGDVASWFHDGKFSPNKCRAHLAESLDNAVALYHACAPHSVIPIEPFSGLTDGAGLKVLSPDQSSYSKLIPKFSGFPVLPPSKALTSFADYLAESADQWEKDNLKNDVSRPSAENESSVVLWFDWEGYKILLTGDAGVNALTHAIVYADSIGIDVNTANLVQVPHHGSRHNVSTPILDAMLGPVGPKNSTNIRRRAFVSAPSKGGPKHPSKRVLNSYLRRETPVAWAKDSGILNFSWNGIPRGWTTVPDQPFFATVESIDD